MKNIEREQVEFILKVVRRYKVNGGKIYQVIGKYPYGKEKRISLADFILKEVGALIDGNIGATARDKV